MQKIVTNLWYDGNAEEAAEFYCSLFPDSTIIRVLRFSDSGMGEPGAVMTVDFELAGQRFTAINGGGEFQYTHAMSLLINCDSQDEVDRLWDALLGGGGKEIECGWLYDKYGVPWQVWPTEADELLTGDPAAVDRATAAMLKMKKIDLRAMRAAYENA
ncbi:VOC family protein [Nocardia cyriacigeorgica]|uniref:VOC family protein n=1 Tax=Nocardia cyriacigeorgica TaxID=135487 RepID=UPI001894CB53|nr:VOC family protein [Nocardia cyriacigeorgica]MBF6452973.1 VOC family protein [Nocardia cyriacigeorgica]MBF6481142.1 VOC family protein [Nocardia cyriacigeorgica]MBF6550142.1 VOC family protein [Nocardia cyriacigeorgica]